MKTIILTLALLTSSISFSQVSALDYSTGEYFGQIYDTLSITVDVKTMIMSQDVKMSDTGNEGTLTYTIEDYDKTTLGGKVVWRFSTTDNGDADSLQYWYFNFNKREEVVMYDGEFFWLYKGKVSYNFITK